MKTSQKIIDKHLEHKNKAFLSVFTGEIPFTGGEAVSSLDLCDHLCTGRDTQYFYTYHSSLEVFKENKEQ